MSCNEKVIIGGIEYAPVQKANGNRFVMVLDRGWVFAGDLVVKDGKLNLTRVVWVFYWESIGLDGVIDNPKNPKAKLRPFKDMLIPSDVELFRIPVSDDWGL